MHLICKFLSMILCIAVIASCATTGDVKSKKVGTNVFKIKVSGYSGYSASQVKDTMWEKAAIIALENGYDIFVESNLDTYSTSSTYTLEEAKCTTKGSGSIGLYGNYTYEGNTTCKEANKVNFVRNHRISNFYFFNVADSDTGVSATYYLSKYRGWKKKDFTKIKVNKAKLQKDWAKFNSKDVNYENICKNESISTWPRMTACAHFASALIDKAGKLTPKARLLYKEIVTSLDSCYTGNTCTIIGWSAKKLKMYDVSEEYLKKALAIYPSPLAKNNLGALWKEMGEIEKAKIIFKEGCMKNKEKYSCYNLATIEKNNDQAELYFEKSLKFGYKHWSYLFKNKDAKRLRSLPNFKKIINKYKN